MNSIVFFLVFLLSGWSCLQPYVLGVDGAGRFPFWFSLLFLLLMVARDPKKLKMHISQPVVWLWCGAIFALVNTALIGIQHILFVSDEIFVYRVLSPVFLFIYVYLGCKIDQRKCLLVLLGTLYLGCVIFLFHADLNAKGTGEAQMLRLSGEELNSNFFAFFTITAFFVALFYDYKYGMPKLLLLAAAVFSGILVFFSLSRTGYIGFFILLCASFAGRWIRPLWKAIGLLVVLGLLLAANHWVMRNTDVGRRFALRDYEIRTTRYTTGTAWDNIMGERTVYLVSFMELFPQHPFRGVGEYNFIAVNPLTETVCHNEYLRSLSEEGLIGFTFFALFFLTLIWRLVGDFKKFPERRKILLTCGSGILCVLFLYMGSFSMPVMHIILAICAAELFVVPPPPSCEPEETPEPEEPAA